MYYVNVLELRLRSLLARKEAPVLPAGASLARSVEPPLPPESLLASAKLSLSLVQSTARLC